MMQWEDYEWHCSNTNWLKQGSSTTWSWRQYYKPPRGSDREERRWWVREWILRRPLFSQYETLMKELEAEHAADFKAFLRRARSSSGQASAGVPYIGQPPVLYFPRLCPTSAGARSERGRCPLKKRCPLVVSDARDTGRYSAVQSNSNKHHGCPAGVRPSSVKIASLAHRNLIGRAMWLGHEEQHLSRAAKIYVAAWCCSTEGRQYCNFCIHIKFV